MALSNAIKKATLNRVISLATVGVMSMTLLSGCSGDGGLSGTIADKLKPDVNRRQKLLTDPAMVVSTFPEAYNDPYQDYQEPGDDVGGNPVDPGGNGGVPPVDPGPGADVGGNPRPEEGPTTEPTAHTTVPHDTYVTYLREKVLPALDENIGNNKHLYYRVFTLGMNYNEYTVTTTFPAGEHTETRLTQGTALDAGNYKNFLSSTRVDGLVMNNFAMQYLGQVGSNDTSVEKAVEKAVARFSANGIADSWTPDEVPEDNAFRKTDLFKMWSAEGNSGLRADQFIAKLGTGSLDAGTMSYLPNIILSYYTAKNSYGGRATLNCIQSKDEGYTKSMQTLDVGAVFAHTSQFPTRATKYDLNVNNASETEMLRAYVDGYNVTVIYVGLIKSDTGPVSIRDALEWDSDAYNAVYNAVQGAATPDQISALESAGYTFTPVPSGVREGA